MRKTSQKLWIGLVLVTLGLLSVGMAVQAHGESRPPRPSDFWGHELVLGWYSSIAGGFVGLLFLCHYPGYPDLKWGFMDCNLLYRMLTGRDMLRDMSDYHLLFYSLLAFGGNLGRALGASTGVVLAGMMFGVDGNIWGAYLTTGLWFVTTLYVERWLPLVPLVPALVATIGYNWGAKMKSEKSRSAALGWKLPLVHLRF